MEQKDKEEEFERLWREHQEEMRGIIAIVGAPYTMKTLLAKHIGRRLKCPVLCIQDFLSEAAMASDEEVLQHAFTNLCKVAQRHIQPGPRLIDYGKPQYRFYDINSKVVIKSRLNSKFELQRLLDLYTSTRPRDIYGPAFPLLIIECRFTNEYLWKEHFERVRLKWSRYREEVGEEDCSWYRPKSWKEMEKERDDYYHPQTQANLDLLIQQLIQEAPATKPLFVRRMVVDPIDILSFSDDYFTYSIKYLLTTGCDIELINKSQDPHFYKVEFRELRGLYLFDKRIDAILAAKGRSDDLCPMGGCTFKYWEGLIHHHDNHVCWACDKQVDSGVPAYTCRLCILTLHKSCAERINFKALRFDLNKVRQKCYYYNTQMPEEHACKSCVDKGTGFNIFCESCTFQTHLKCGLIPTIINHNSHPAPHFLSFQVSTEKYYRCNACGVDERDIFSYCCKQCGLYYHLRCALLPLELHKHEHGGHEHVMKLLYSHHDTDDDKEPEESYWCEVCYKDMDPQAWLYSCKDCPYYAAHLHCARGYKYLSNVKNAKFVQQIQSQLEDAMAETNDDTEKHLT